jgi:S-adenosylmethionine:tRNA ribosyltransferase-isomerase
VRTADLDYELPAEMVARYPAERRDGSRLMRLGSRSLGEPNRDHTFAELAELIEPGSLLVVNDTRVMPARLLGQKETGGRFELLLVRERAVGEWLALVRTSKKVRLGTRATVADTVAVTVEDGPDDEGLFVVRLSAIEGELDEALAAGGHMPLPPYLGRADEPMDRERYQTIFASQPGAVAAPTAGLHFTEGLLDALRAADVSLAQVTLHVGPGTFKPVSVDELDAHPMHGELYTVCDATAQAIASARERGAPVVAVGTTVVRALESCADPDVVGRVRAGSGETHLLIQPGYRFRVVDALITNFHLPKSTLLALVYAFAGLDEVRAAYREAIERRYRFYSYGDAMFLPQRKSV